jgi:hypothetical protein
LASGVGFDVAAKRKHTPFQLQIHPF